jgi:hypothetical protein
MGVTENISHSTAKCAEAQSCVYRIFSATKTKKKTKLNSVALVRKRTIPIEQLCGLVVRVTGYRSRGPGFYYRHYQIFWEVVGLEQGPLSLVRLLQWKSSGSGPRKPRLTAVGIHCADHTTPSIRKIWHFSATSHKKTVSGHMLIWTFFCFGTWNSCPKFVRTFLLLCISSNSVTIYWIKNWKRYGRKRS